MTQTHSWTVNKWQWEQHTGGRIESCRKERDGESLKEPREGTDAANVARSIKAMELLLCTLGFLWLTSTSADHILPQNRHTHTHTTAQACTHMHPVQIHKHACTFRGVFNLQHVGRKTRWVIWGRNRARRKEKVWEREKRWWIDRNHKMLNADQQHSSIIFIYPFTCCNNMNTLKMSIIGEAVLLGRSWQQSRLCTVVMTYNKRTTRLCRKPLLFLSV